MQSDDDSQHERAGALLNLREQLQAAIQDVESSLDVYEPEHNAQYTGASLLTIRGQLSCGVC